MIINMMDQEFCFILREVIIKVNLNFEDDDNILNKTVYNWSNRLEIEKPEKTLYKSKSDYDIF